METFRANKILKGRLAIENLNLTLTATLSKVNGIIEEGSKSRISSKSTRIIRNGMNEINERRTRTQPTVMIKIS